MRLINTGTLQLEEFFDALVPEYAILSHTWEMGEVLFRDMEDLDKARAKPGFAKLQGACTLAATHGYDYIWIDTCCIDKSSSAELTEAINSMYKWYKGSRICYAYLCDVEKADQLEDSRWFTRGWTLQELIAPRRVEFYTASWSSLGKKSDSGLISPISRASLVDECVLSGVVDLRHEVSVAKRMYWASKRKTTRKEDEAYCLMGLFDVNMPLLYGEGTKAFIRLQQEISKGSEDQSILAWYCDPKAHPKFGVVRPCFALSPACFAMSGNIFSLPQSHLERPLGRIEFMGSLAKFSAILGGTRPNGLREIILWCQIGPIPGTFPTLELHHNAYNRYVRHMNHGVVSQHSWHSPESLITNVGIPCGVLSDSYFWRSHATNFLGLKVVEEEWEPRGGVAPRAIMVMGTGDIEDEEKRRFTVEGLTISEVVTWTARNQASLSPSGDKDEDENEDEDRDRRWLGELSPHTFWLVPLATRRSEFRVSVLDVHPIERWNRSNNQLIWTPEMLRPTMVSNPDALNLPITAGVARIRLDPVNTTAEAVTGDCKMAVVAFGLILPSFGAPTMPWCHVVKDDGVSDLEQLFATQISGAERSLLMWDAGILLHAEAVRTDVSGSYYDLIKLWVTEEVVGEGDTAVAEH